MIFTTPQEIAAAIDEAMDGGGSLVIRFGHAQMRQLKPQEVEILVGALKTVRPEAGSVGVPCGYNMHYFDNGAQHCRCGLYNSLVHFNSSTPQPPSSQEVPVSCPKCGHSTSVLSRDPQWKPHCLNCNELLSPAAREPTQKESE